MLFPLGQLVATPGALAMEEKGISLGHYICRHSRGDWGDLDDEDKKENEFSLHRRLRLFSSYNTPAGRLWLITEADRASTCALCPDEY